MAITLEQLLFEVKAKGVQQTKRDIAGVSQSVRGLEASLRDVGTLGGMLYMFSEIGNALGVVGRISGTFIAAQFGSAEFKLRQLVGTGRQYRDLLRDLNNLGGNKLALGATAATMIASGVGVGSVAGDLAKLRDATSAGGAKPSDFNDILFNIMQMRSMGSAKADFSDVREMLSRAPGISRVLAAGLGVKQEDVLSTLRGGSMTGTGIYEALLKGGASTGIAGSYQKQLAEDPIAAWEDLMREWSEIMLPTGRLIIEIFKPLVPVTKTIGTILKGINENSGGLFGMAGLMAGALWVATRRLTHELGALVLAMGAAAGATRINTGAQATGAVAGLLGPGAAAAGGAAAGGILARLGPFLPRLIRGLGIGAIVGGVLGMIGNAVSGDGTDPGRKAMGGLIGNIGLGAGIGAGIGSFFGPGGALIGGGIGIIGGLLKDGIESYFGMGKDKAAATDPVLGELKKQTNALDEIKANFRGHGGGARTGSAISSFQLEWQISKVLGI